MGLTDRVSKHVETLDKPSGPTKCVAYGCPLHGSISSSTHPKPGQDWFCRFHFGEPAEEWQAITHSINTYESRRLEGWKPLPEVVGLNELRYRRP